MKLSASHLLLAVTSLGSLCFSAAKEHIFVPPNIRGLQDADVTIGDEGDNTTIAEGKEGTGDPNSACCAEDDLETLTFKFTRGAGGTCDATDNDQKKDKDEQCDGDVGPGNPITITLSNAEFVGAGDDTERSFPTNAEFTIKPESDSKKNKFESTTKIRVGGQDLEIHTSCSQPLNFGDVFGALTVVNSSPRPIPECVVCVDDKPRGRTDTGCNTDCPLCDEAEEECRVCLNDRRGAKQDSGCPIETPVCVARFNEYGEECAICKVGNFPDKPDMGCSIQKPICDSDETGCFKCQNNEPDSPDRGCLDPLYPHCVAPDGGFGNECASCVNNVGEGVDTGCTAEAPFCVADWWKGGSLCAPCINNQEDPTIADLGCPAAEPLCNGDFGGPGTECTDGKVCTDSKDFGGQDSGCPIETPVCIEVDNKCVVCKVTDSNPNAGCSEDKPWCNTECTGCFKCQNNEPDSPDRGCPDPLYPHCVAPDGGFGNECASCVNNVGTGVDTGCTAEARFCVADWWKGGSLCAPCINNQEDPTIADLGCNDVNAKQCNGDFGGPGTECTNGKVCKDTKPFGGQDSGCPIETPVCDNPRGSLYGDECIVCKITDEPVDKGCGGDKPYCNPECTGCFKCQNNQEQGFVLDGPRPGDDRGCPARYPHCVAPFGGFGNECASCVNDGSLVNEGCTPEAPICVADWWEGGILCAKCVNDEGDTNLADSGCVGLNKLCEADLGQPGKRCRECTNDDLGNGIDGGCGVARPFCGEQVFGLGFGGGADLRFNPNLPTLEPLDCVFGECYECRVDPFTRIVSGCDGPLEICVDENGNQVPGIPFNLGRCFLPPPAMIPCGTTYSGFNGMQFEAIVVELGQSSGNFSVNYDMFSAPDGMVIEYEGDEVFSTNGTMANTNPNPINVIYSGNSTSIVVIMETGPGSSIWEFTIGCPGNVTDALGATFEADGCETCKKLCGEPGKPETCEENECGPICDAEN